jgi:hypothetical protein
MSDVDEALAKLREPFPPETVGKLPKITCGDCRRSEGKSCSPQHRRRRCGECGSYVTPAHIDLAYIGHADVTARLLDVDPWWTWEPLVWDERGFPAVDANNGMWIRLSVAGVHRLGYGHPDGKTGGDAVKETIGDALRNAAMRFGVGLDLWRKESPGADQSDSDALKREIAEIGQAKGYDPATIESDFAKVMNGADIRAATLPVLAEYRDRIKSYPPAGDGADE